MDLAITGIGPVKPDALNNFSSSGSSLVRLACQ